MKVFFMGDEQRGHFSMNCLFTSSKVCVIGGGVGTGLRAFRGRFFAAFFARFLGAAFLTRAGDLTRLAAFLDAFLAAFLADFFAAFFAPLRPDFLAACCPASISLMSCIYSKAVILFFL